VTLVGPAGVGKTRLAIEAARSVDLASGAWLVRLEAAQDTPSMVRTIAEALGVAGGIEAMVIDHLRASDALLVLDGCEHIVDAVAAIVTRLLDAAPWLGILATSQAALGLDGETTYVLDPLGLDDSVELFTRRAREQRRTLVLDERSEVVIAQLCRALDGLPLAIELAAARARTLSVEEIDRRLADRFALLADPTSRRPGRRRALGAAIAWSYDLLFPDDRTGLWALACFTGGAPLQAVEHVLEALGIPLASAVDVVGRLVDRSLVAVEIEGEAVRYRLLDSIRIFAREKLDASGRAETALAAHAAWFASAATEVASGLRGPDQARHLGRARQDGANIDAALMWTRDRDPALGLQIAKGFGWAWFVLGEGAAGTDRLRRSLAAGRDDATIEDQVTILCTGAWIEASNDVEAAHADATHALSMAETVGDELLVAASRTALAFVLLQMGRPADVGRVLDGTPEVFRRLSRPWDEGAARILIAHGALLLGDVALARQACEQGDPLVRASGDDWALSHLDAILANLAQAEGRLDDAAAHLRSSSEACHRLGFRATEGFHLAALGRVLQRAGDPRAAVTVLEEAIEVGRSAQEMRVVALARVRLGRVLRAEGEDDAARAAVDAADHWFRFSGGGEGAALAAFLAAALDADHDAAEDRFRSVLAVARRDHDVEVEVLALDGLALVRGRAGDLAAAADHLASADARMSSAAHLLDDAERIDARLARTLITG
jgi:predicted ATPase/tetratricopeptide (TPR) repeat protein